MAANQSALYNLDVPDDIGKLRLDCNLKDGEAEELVELIYSSVEHKKACDILRAHASRLKGTLTTSRMPSVVDSEDANVGDFLNALINKTGIKKLIVDKLYANKVSFGEGLPAGKTLVVGKTVYADAIGKDACGGTVINSANVQKLGEGARDSFFVNSGLIDSLGNNARDDILVNFGHVSYIGSDSKRCMLMHYSDWLDLTSVGMNSCDTVVVTTGSSDRFVGTVRDRYEIGFGKLLFDRPLNGLVKGVRKACTDGKYGNARDLARKVDEHVRQNYEPGTWRKIHEGGFD